MTSQCTDQCVVIACTDPDHSGAPCSGENDPVLCNLVCDSSTNCVDCNGFDAFLQCCTPSLVQGQVQLARGPPQSMPTTDFWCDDCTVTPQQQQQVFFSPTPMQSHAQALELPHKCMWHGCKASFSSLSDLVGHVNLLHLRPLPESKAIPIQPPPQQIPSPVPEPPSLLSCLWDECGLYLSPQNIAGTSNSSEISNLLSALECHLLQDHLGLHTSASCDFPQQNQTTATSSTMPSTTTDTFFYEGDAFHTHHPQYHFPHTHDDAGMAEVFAASAATTPSSSSATTPAFPSATPHLDSKPTCDSTSSGASTSSTPTFPSATPHLESKPTRNTTGTHHCAWEGCDAPPFASSNELTAHLTSAHVGGGKARYECFWKDCDRHGLKGFSSKQKICRHLQSHTGHRPFQCTLCHQNFSEAATLQQHMRRHTQEKPYACDFPGCGKSFAIMGALTIHKRIHNGQKPFKCTYCSRAFTESSNLSKHLRTHTGARPYTCTEQGCGKSFARPDQLTRHMGVHKKNGAGGGGGIPLSPGTDSSSTSLPVEGN